VHSPLIREGRAVHGQRDIRGALAEFTGSGAATLATSRLCDFGVDRLDMQGVGVALISSPEARSLLAASGDLAGRTEELQFSLGEGPCLDAFVGVAPCTEGYLAAAGGARWPAFAPAAVAEGIQAVFAFPLSVGRACFGVLDLARERPGTLNNQEMDDALALADIATETVLAIQSESLDGEIADELGGTTSERIVVHQATGMVSAQANINIVDALARLRAHAYASDQHVVDVAQEVVARTFEFGES
jgi:hypothetical protein